eukprot:c56083_g1_i1 orf=25-219(+)
MTKVEIGEVLSDHKPVSWDGRVEGEVIWRPGYYKINTTLIGTREGKTIIEEAFQPHNVWLGMVA